MPKRVLIIGYVLMEYMGEKPISYKGKVPVGSRKYAKVEKGDMVVADEVTAITFCRGTQWRRVEHDLDIATLFANVQNEPIKEMTQLNLDDFSDEQLIALAKEKNITGITVRSSRDKVIPLLLPFLPT